MSQQRSVRATLALLGAVVALGAAGAAQARGGVDFSIGIATPGLVIGGGAPVYGAPVYAAPPPVYYAPPPQPVYYPPAPVYSVPRPVYYAPPPVFVQPRPVYYGPGYGRPWGPPPGHWDRGGGRGYGGGGWHGR